MARELTRAKWGDKMDNLADAVAAVDREIQAISVKASEQGPLAEEAVNLTLLTRYLLRQAHRNLIELRDDDLFLDGWD